MLMVDVGERNGTDALLDGNPMGGWWTKLGMKAVIMQCVVLSCCQV